MASVLRELTGWWEKSLPDRYEKFARTGPRWRPAGAVTALAYGGLGWVQGRLLRGGGPSTAKPGHLMSLLPGGKGVGGGILGMGNSKSKESERIRASASEHGSVRELQRV